MKDSRRLVALAVLNAVLGLCIAALMRHSATPAGNLMEGSTEEVPAPAPASSGAPTSSGAVSAERSKFSYRRQVFHRELATYVSNLRAVHCPEQVLQDIILAEINRRFAGREASARLKRSQRDWWDPEATATGNWERRSTLFNLWQEKAALVKELLGMDLPMDATPINPSRPANDRLEASLAKLPEAKRAPTREVVTRLFLAQRRIEERVNGIMLRDDPLEWQKVHSDARAELERMLTREELAEVELRGSGVESDLRGRLAAFEPTAEEFQKMIELEASYRPWRSLPGQPAGTDAQQAVAEAQKLQTQQVEMLLGPERFAEYQRSQNPTYQSVAATLQAQGLSRSTVVESFRVIEQAQREINSVTRSGNISSAETRTNLERVTQRAQDQLRQIIGEEAWQRLSGRMPGLPRFSPVRIPPKP